MYVLASKSHSFDRVKQTVPHASHTIAVQMKHLVRCIAGKAPEDSIAVRLQEKSLDRFQDSWITASTETSSSSTSSNKKGKEKTEKNTSQKEATSLPTAPFGLNNKQQEKADKRAKEVIAPAKDSFIPQLIFSQISKLNTHEWKEVTVT